MTSQINTEKNNYCELFCIKSIYNYPCINKNIVYKLAGMIHELDVKEIKNIVENDKLLLSTILEGLNVLLSSTEYEEYSDKNYIYQVQIAYVYILKQVGDFDKSKKCILNFIYNKLQVEYLFSDFDIQNILKMISSYSLESIFFIFMEKEMLKKLINNTKY